MARSIALQTPVRSVAPKRSQPFWGAAVGRLVPLAHFRQGTLHYLGRQVSGSERTGRAAGPRRRAPPLGQAHSVSTPWPVRAQVRR